MNDRKLEDSAREGQDTFDELINTIEEFERYVSELKDEVFVLTTTKEELMEQLDETVLENIELKHQLIDQEHQLAEIVKKYALSI